MGQIDQKNATGWHALTWTQLVALIVVAWCGLVGLAALAGVALALVKLALKFGWVQAEFIVRILKPW